MPSSGNASRFVTRTRPVAPALRRKGSSSTVNPAPTGNKLMIVPITTALARLKNPRRSSSGGGAGKFVLLGSFILSSYHETQNLKEMFPPNERSNLSSQPGGQRAAAHGWQTS